MTPWCSADAEERPRRPAPGDVTPQVMTLPQGRSMAIGDTGLLIIRAYSEADSSSPLRAEIRLTRDVSAGIERTLNLADTGCGSGSSDLAGRRP
jgi:hypothetical protein